VGKTEKPQGGTVADILTFTKIMPPIRELALEVKKVQNSLKNRSF
jgi:hypothetical protein